MRTIIALFLTLMAMIYLISSGLRAYAANDFPTAVYDTTLITAAPHFDESNLRIVSDGKGHIRGEWQYGEEVKSTITIIDYVKKQTFVLNQSKRTAMEIPFYPNSLIIDETDLQTINAKSLGAKEYCGDHCHIYETRDKYGVYKAWLGNDSHHIVYIEHLFPNGGGAQLEGMRLGSWSSVTPSPNLFKIPVGYKRLYMSATSPESSSKRFKKRTVSAAPDFSKRPYDFYDPFCRNY
jgi:hypothetical protein